jgi:hypothetical protein
MGLEDYSKKFAFVKSIATSDGDTDLLTAPATGETLWVCQINVTIHTAAAQSFRIEDKGSSPIVYFSAPNSLAVGTYNVPLGPMGVAVSASATTLEFDTSAAGVGCIVSGWGYIRA